MIEHDRVAGWQALAMANQWAELVRSTEQEQAPALLVVSALWRARALRALDQGDEANTLLLTTSRGKFEVPAAHLAELTEELIQAAYYEDAARLAARLQRAGLPQADYLWAVLWREREDWGQCEAALARLALYGGEWQMLAEIQTSWLRLRQGRIALAAEHLSPLAANPHPGIQKLLARLELAQGQFAAACTRLEAVSRLQPLDWEWPPLLAAALAPSQLDKDPQKIMALFQQGLQRQPRQAEALFNRARLCLILGDGARAQQDCDQSLTIKPWFDAPVLLWVEQALGQKDYARAHAILNQARLQLDTPKRAAAALDVLRLQGSKNKLLVEAADAALKIFPDDFGLLRTAGAAYQSAKKLDQAARCYAQVLERVPDDSATANNLAQLYRDRGDLEEALHVWRGIVDRRNLTVQLNYAFALLERGDKLEAERRFASGLASAPDHPQALRGMAEVHYAAGRIEPAWELACRAVRADTSNPLSWKTAAGIARRRGGDAAAIQVLSEGEGQAQPVLPIRQALFQRYRVVLSPDELLKQVMRWCEGEAQEADYWLMAADAAFDANDFEHCEALIKQAMAVDVLAGGPALVRFYLGRDRQGAARRVAEQLVRDDPSIMKHWGLLGEVLYRQERFAEALRALDEGLQREPTRLALHRQKIGILLAREQFEAAVAAAQQFYELEPGILQLDLLREALCRAQRFDEASILLSAARQKQPNDRTIALLLVNVLQLAGRQVEALAELAVLYSKEPENFDVVQRYSRALIETGRYADACQLLRNLAEKSGQRPELMAAIVEILREDGALTEAADLLGAALARSPEYLPLWHQQAMLAKRRDDGAGEKAAWLEIIRRFPPRQWAAYAIADLIRLGLDDELLEALNAWRVAEPASRDPWWAAFRAAKEMKKNDLALQMLDKIETLGGGKVPEVMAERANILHEGWLLTPAISNLQQAIALRPDRVSFIEDLLNILVKAGDFDDFDRLMGKLEHLLGDRRYSRFRNFFFNINCHPNWTAAEVWRFYKEWYERSVKPGLPPPKAHVNPSDPARKLRIGYLSPDFRRHAVAYFSEPLLIEHDREQFELYAYAHLDAGQADGYTERFKTYFDHWTETRGMSDDELERKIREDQIDILVDLAGHTSNNRLSLMLRRPAPIQASWIWGAGQTTGLPQVDYFLTDSASVPPEHDAYMAEKVARMSRPGLPFKPAHDVLEPTPLPCLSNGFITFGVLARPLRTNRNTVALWAKILQRVPTSILRFDHVPYAEADVQQRLIGYFAEHGISPERLQFKNTRPHWQVYQEIDLQLDPFPAGSGTTASEGLYMERLVVTLKSRPPMGLIAHGQLEAMGLDPLCTADTEDEYVEKAVALVDDCQRLAELSAGLRERVKNSWLMDYAGYGREVAGMYRQMWRDWCANKDQGKL